MGQVNPDGADLQRLVVVHDRWEPEERHWQSPWGVDVDAVAPIVGRCLTLDRKG